MSSDLSRQTREQQTRNGQSTDRATALVAKIQGQQSGIASALADRIGAERFLRAAATEIRTTPKLAACSDDSILGALYVAAQLGLEVGGPRGLVYLVPYGKEASLVVGYRGWIDLLYRAGAKSVQWFLVREGDQFRIGSDAVHGLTYYWEQADPNSTRAYTGAVAQVETATGGLVWEYMTRQQILERSTGSPIWKQWPEPMALKTVLRSLVKRLPTSTELSLAQSADETVQRRHEVPGLPAENTVEHLPLTATPVEARPAAPPRPATPSPRPGTPPRTAPPAPTRQEAPSGPQEPEEALQDVEETDTEYEARERAAYEAWLADQEAGR